MDCHRQTTDDRIDYNDIGVSGGREGKITYIRGHVEIGYVWDRERWCSVSGDPPNFTPNDTIMIRVGVSYTNV